MLAAAKAEATRFIRFAAVGAAGFLIDAGLLALLLQAGLDPFSARLVSISASAVTTWRLNRALTFGASSGSQAHEGLRYALIAGLGVGLNYLVYTLALLLVPRLPPLAALVIGTAAAMGLSYVGYSRFAFQGAPTVVGGPSSQSR